MRRARTSAKQSRKSFLKPNNRFGYFQDVYWQGRGCLSTTGALLSVSCRARQANRGEFYLLVTSARWPHIWNAYMQSFPKTRAWLIATPPGCWRGKTPPSLRGCFKRSLRVRYWSLAAAAALGRQRGNSVTIEFGYAKLNV